MDSSRSRRSFSQLSSDEFDSKWFDLKCRIRGRIRSLNSDLKKFYSQFCPNVGQICLKNDFFWPYSAFEYLKFEKSNKFVRADKSQPHQKYFIKKRFLFSSNLKFHLLLESQIKKYYWYINNIFAIFINFIIFRKSFWKLNKIILIVLEMNFYLIIIIKYPRLKKKYFFF